MIATRQDDGWSRLLVGASERLGFLKGGEIFSKQKQIRRASTASPQNVECGRKNTSSKGALGDNNLQRARRQRD